MSLILLKVSPVVMSISEENYSASLDLWRPERTDDRLAVVMFTSTSDNILILMQRPCSSNTNVTNYDITRSLAPFVKTLSQTLLMEYFILIKHFR